MTDFGFLSTYPPTRCGLATFTAALRERLTPPGGPDTSGVVRVLDEPLAEQDEPTEVVATLVPDDPDPGVAAQALNAFHAVIVQHEYGIYGGRDGEDLIPLLDAVKVPTIVVAHTVLSAPTFRQRRILQEVAGRADAVVVMSETAKARLTSWYRVDPGRVAVIPHGADIPEIRTKSEPETKNNFEPETTTETKTKTETEPERETRAEPEPEYTHRPLILTWGLLGRDKGIEWGIDSLSRLHASGIPAHYLVAGRTHPKLLDYEGDIYRESLIARAADAGLSEAVIFDPGYRDDGALKTLIFSADVVLLPYESNEQVTSGVLIESVACRRPVVATGFPHAVELLSSGAGFVVPRHDAEAMAHALRRVLTEPGLAASMAEATANIAPTFDWRSVADRYRDLAATLIEHPGPLAA